MKTDYKAVVEAMELYIAEELEACASGEMMSMAEMIHGKIAAQNYGAKLESLIVENTK